MIQTFINKYFFFLLIFSLVFVVILYNLIGFQFTDEICAILLFILFFHAVLNTPNWEFNKVFLFTLGVFVFYTIYSFLIGSNTGRAIFNDLIIQMKPYLGFFCAYQLKPFFSDSRKRLLKNFSLLVWFILLLPIGMVGIISVDFLHTTMGHPAYFGIAVTIVSLCYLYSCDFTKRDKVIFLMILFIGLFSGKSKFYGFYALAFFIIFFFNSIRQFKLNFKNIMLFCAMIGTIVLVAWQKIYFYFFQAITGATDIDRDMMARFVLYRTFPEIIADYFPFGSGFATYATHSSGEYYSNIYVTYGLDSVWGLSKSYTSFVSDTYYPSLAQFGVVGIILFLLFWVFVIKKAIRLYKMNSLSQSKNLIVILLIIGFLAIESTTGSTFISQGGFFVMMLLGLTLSDMQYNSVKCESCKDD